ncbi:glycosyl hydrolase family 95 catalytic domain-containing protein [Litchfieldia salsa]|nr:glycoside hydrolase N-terminal domain-containing protein [Litchfieldia salsa]
MINNVPIRGAWNKTYGDSWEESLVSGNGIQGVMVLGNPENELIIGNHARLYLPTGTGKPLPDMSPFLERFRSMIKEDGYEQAIKFYYKKALELGYEGLQMSDPFHPGFHLNIHLPIQSASHYSRSVDFESGEIHVTFTDLENTRHSRKTFVSRADDVIVHTIENSQQNVSCTLFLEEYQHELMNQQSEVGINYIHVRNNYVMEPGGFQVIIKIEAPQGKIKLEDNRINIEQAEHVLLIAKIVPFQKSTQLDNQLFEKELEKIEETYNQLFNRHQALHQEIFHRVALNLCSDEQRIRAIEDLFSEAKESKVLPLALIEKMYDAGRYMFMCSAGELSPNLQGIWTGTFTPAWSGDFTFDTNVQLSIASALSCNMDEGLHGYFRLVKELLPGFRDNAKYFYGSRGIMSTAHSSNSGRQFHWNDEWPLHLWTCGAGWLGHWFYQYYLFTGDKNFLENETIPYLKECALFYEDFLIEDSDGTNRFTPSYSAENGCGDNATQDIAVAKEVLRNLINSHRELKIDTPEITKWETMLSKLPGYMINDEGALKEWSIDGKGENYNHRHFSHLYSVFQSREFNDQTEPLLWEASKVALEKRLDAWLRSDDGDTSSTHGRMHAALCATQFNKSDLVYEILQMMVVNDSMFPSLITSHYNQRHLFNVDGNGAIPQIINEMIIDAVPGEIVLLRAIPKQLSKGTLEGVRLVKQIIADQVLWDLEDRTLKLYLTSSIEQQVVIKAPHAENLVIKQYSGCEVNTDCDLIRLQLNENIQAFIDFTL